MRRDRWSSA